MNTYELTDKKANEYFDGLDKPYMIDMIWEEAQKKLLEWVFDGVRYDESGWIKLRGGIDLPALIKDFGL